MKQKRIVTWRLTLKLVLGILFIVSAVVKIADMDRFEIYIYSYHFFSLNFSFLVARAAIIAELVLGIGLISNCLHKLMWWGSVLMLIGYAFFLFYAFVIGRTDSCHCFGEYLQLNPWQSIVKNIVLLALFALVYKVKGFCFKREFLALIGVAVIALVVVFVVSPPDNYMPNYNEKGSVQTELLYKSMQQAPLDSLHLDEGKKVLCFFSTGCDYCKMAVEKLSLMQEHYHFSADNVYCAFLGTAEGIDRFFEETGIRPYQSVVFEDVVQLLKITDGNFPVVVFLEKGRVVHAYGFRSMKETEIKAFFQN